MKYIPKRNTIHRRTSYIIAEYTVKEGRFRDIIKNIGAGGLFVRTSRKVAVGQSIALQFPLFDFDQTIQVTGILHWEGIFPPGQFARSSWPGIWKRMVSSLNTTSSISAIIWGWK